ncbi:MAG: DUF2156 domain-containing protein [Clostridia bacterium]|nr:DUF2156 domain-containing protein [Clostridia bacterium]
MNEFQRLTRKSLFDLAPFLKGLNYLYADYSIGYIFMYDEYVEYEYCILDNVFYLRYNRDDSIVYLLPVCREEKLSEAIKRIIDWNKNSSKKVILRSVPDKYVDMVLSLTKAQLSRNEKWADYVYDAVAFASLVGKKYHAKRNYISRFKRLYGECTFEQITDKNIEKVKNFFENFKKGEDKKTKIFQMELNATALMLEHLDLEGIEHECMIMGGKVIGFTVGEKVGNTLIVHIEKCDKNYEGVYETLTNHFAKRMIETYPEIEYINREDDAGDEGLKKAKLSYHPKLIAVKNDFTLCVN